jgi:hypothetical protein
MARLAVEPRDAGDAAAVVLVVFEVWPGYE